MAEGQSQAAGNNRTVDIRCLELELVAAKQKHIQSGHETRSKDFAIKRVAAKIRDVDSDQYTPSFVSIGPFHWSNASIAREEDKLKCLGAVFSAVSTEAIHTLLAELVSIESRARSCYDNSLVEGMPPTQFMRMLLLDGCYILQKFVKSTARQAEDQAITIVEAPPLNSSDEQEQEQERRLTEGSTSAPSNARREQRTAEGTMTETLAPPNASAEQEHEQEQEQRLVEGTNTMAATSTRPNASDEQEQEQEQRHVQGTATTTSAAPPNASSEPEQQQQRLAEDTTAASSEPPNASVEQDQKKYNKVTTQVARDVVYLVENQIPFFVLEEINKKACWSTRNTLSDVFGSFIRDRVLKPHEYAVDVEPTFSEQPFHILHLLHMHIAGHINRQPAASATTDKERVKCWRRATEYDMACVKFRKQKLVDGGGGGGARSILDLELIRGHTATVMLPALNIDDDTPRILRNLVALEQQNSVVLRGDADVGGHITAYCAFLSRVACTTEDVALLLRMGVITHLMENDQKCAEYLGKLFSGVVFDLDDPKQNYLLAECRALDRRVKSPWWRRIAVLKHRYCRNNPWAVIGVVAAAILLVCAIVQSIYSVKAYKW